MKSHKGTLALLAFAWIAIQTAGAAGASLTQADSDGESAWRRSESEAGVQVAQAEVEEPEAAVETYAYQDFSDDPLLAESSGQIDDPIKNWNLVWYHFNDKTYYWLLKPTAKGYKFILPRTARHGVKNFMINLEMPIRFFNSLFQGRSNQAGEEIGRFVVNTTVGVLGFGDPATHWLEMDTHFRDMDQSLAKGGADKGVYLVWPIAGPSSVRGTFGWVSDTLMDVGTYIPGSGILQIVNSISLDEWEYEEVVEASLDPYVAIRSGYVQYRDEKAKE